MRATVWKITPVAVALALLAHGGVGSPASAQPFTQPANDGEYLRMRNAEARLNALENEQALARLKNTPGVAAPAAPLGSWIPGGLLAGEDPEIRIAALKNQVQAQQKALDRLQKEVARVCGSDRGDSTGPRQQDFNR